MFKRATLKSLNIWERYIKNLIRNGIFKQHGVEYWAMSHFTKNKN